MCTPTQSLIRVTTRKGIPLSCKKIPALPHEIVSQEEVAKGLSREQMKAEARGRVMMLHGHSVRYFWGEMRVDELFSQADKNGDDVLDLGEWIQLLILVGKLQDVVNVILLADDPKYKHLFQ